jgi:hypothetical protein
MHMMKPSFAEFTGFHFHMTVVYKSCCLSVYFTVTVTVNENMKQMVLQKHKDKWGFVCQLHVQIAVRLHLEGNELWPEVVLC